MTATAIVMMLIAIGIVWGGLIAAILFLRREPELQGGPFADQDPDHAGPPHVAG